MFYISFMSVCFAISAVQIQVVSSTDLFEPYQFNEIAVGVGGSDVRDQSAPTQTAPQQVGFGSDRDCGVDKVSRGPHDSGLG